MINSATSLDATHLKYGMKWLFTCLVHKKSKNGFILCIVDVKTSSKQTENIGKQHFTRNNSK